MGSGLRHNPSREGPLDVRHRGHQPGALRLYLQAGERAQRCLVARASAVVGQGATACGEELGPRQALVSHPGRQRIGVALGLVPLLGVQAHRNRIAIEPEIVVADAALLEDFLRLGK